MIIGKTNNTKNLTLKFKIKLKEKFYRIFSFKSSVYERKWIKKTKEKRTDLKKLKKLNEDA